MCMSTPSVPAPPPVPAEPKAEPKVQAEQVARARSQKKKEALSKGGTQSTLLNGASGLMAPVTTGSTTALGGS